MMTHDHEYQYRNASGDAFDDCSFLGLRFPADAEFSPEEMDSWVLRGYRRDGALKTDAAQGRASWYSGLWRSPSGAVFVSDEDDAIHLCRDLSRILDEQSWEEFSMPAGISGVWGLDDGCVFAWGRQSEDNVMFRWNGREWTQMPSPGRVVALSGLAPNFVYAAGYDSLLARWDGHSWHRIVLPIRDSFSGLFVVGSDEMYASGQGGHFLEGSSHGWSLVARHPGPLHAVVKWHDSVWIAAGEDGLLRRKGNTAELECVKPNIAATSFDARKDLVITCADMICGTPDGHSFSAGYRDGLEKHLAGEPPLWEQVP